MRRYLSVVDSLRRVIERNPRFETQSIGRLAAQWGVSYKTMAKAVRVLADDGIVACSRGKPPALHRQPRGDSGHAEAPGHAGAAARLAQKLLGRINGGAYPVAEELPKVDFLARLEHASPATIAEAFRILHSQAAVHKSGRKWFAGPARHARAGAVPHSELPAILLLISGGYAWAEYFASAHLMPFSAAFNAEMLKAGLRVLLVFAYKGPDTPAAIPTGKDAIDELIRSLGRHYRGTLIYHNPPFGDELHDILALLSTYGEPIVYLDATGESPGLIRGVPRRRCLCFRAFFDEPAAVRAALDALCDRGHEVIGVPLYDVPGFAWSRRRLRLVREDARSRPAAPRIVVAPLKEGFWRFEDYSAIGTSLQVLGAAPEGDGAPGVSRGTRQLLLDKTPSLSSLLDEKVTALLALNDRMAWEFLVWLRAAGIRVPQRLSLVSFDNMAQSAVFPISTVDFGFARLGYLAAHVFVGDISVQADANGDIPGVCQLVDRGSVGPAGSD